MYRCFKDCLLSPSKIINHLMMSKRKIVLYFLLLVLLYSLSIGVIFISNIGKMGAFSDALETDFIQNEAIDYQIVDGKLQTTDTALFRVIETKTFSETLGINTHFIYTMTGEYKTNLYVNHIYFIFTADKLEVKLATKDVIIIGEQLKLSNSNSDGLVNVFSVNYSEADIKNINFNKITGDIEYQLLAFSNRLISYYKPTICAIMIPALILIQTIVLLFEFLIIAVILKLLYRNLNITFGTFYKICILCSTILIVGEVISLLTGFSFVYIICQFLEIIYILITIRLTSMINNMKKNTSETGER